MLVFCMIEKRPKRKATLKDRFTLGCLEICLMHFSFSVFQFGGGGGDDNGSRFGGGGGGGFGDGGGGFGGGGFGSSPAAADEDESWD